MNHSSETHAGYGLYVLIWLTLVVFTSITVAMAGVHLQEWSVAIALLIAGIKAFLVMLFFMHLKYEHILIKLMVGVCLITFVIFITLTFSDVLYR